MILFRIRLVHGFYSINWNLYKILNISGILERKKMADHIFLTLETVKF